jgi:hypothetical protein
MYYAIHQLNFRISEWLILSEKEKAFYIAAIQLRIEEEKKQNEAMKRKVRK